MHTVIDRGVLDWVGLKSTLLCCLGPERRRGVTRSVLEGDGGGGGRGL